MRSNKKSIKKKLLDWLWSAISTNNIQIIHIGEDAAIATDRIRAHIINASRLPDSIHGIAVCELLETDTDATSFLVNPKYLIDALKGFTPSESSIVKIELTGNSQRIIIRDNSDNIATVMCMKEQK